MRGECPECGEPLAAEVLSGNGGERSARVLPAAPRHPPSAAAPVEERHDHLELRQESRYVSCFAHGWDFCAGWTFRLCLSPLRLLLMIIGRKAQDMIGRGNDIHQTLRYESTRAAIAAPPGTLFSAGHSSGGNRVTGPVAGG